MATLADAENTIAQLCANALYPNGTSSPSSIAGAVAARVERGWPTPVELDAATKAGNVIVAVHTISSKKLSPYIGLRQFTIPGPNGLSVSLSGMTATFAGTAGAGQEAGVLTASGPTSVTCISATDAATQIAAAVPGATASGGAVTVPGLVDARAGVPATILTEQALVEAIFWVLVFAPSPAIRDAVESVLFPVLTSTPFVTMPDGSTGRFEYRGGMPDDLAQTSTVYRRTYQTTCQVSVTTSAQAPVALWPTLTISTQT